ncbi:hypothetical protein [Nonomuraea sp. B1E8]|uniref:hypothetical protein n=1 Tax=unclassified Nonomuraea TaxID=2593643 RepID=UPI00325F73CB
MGTPQAEGGDAHGDPRAGLGLSAEQRDVHSYTSPKTGLTTEWTEDPANVEEAYADHIHFHRNGDYPAEPPAPAAQQEYADLLARNRVDPGTAKDELFIKIGAYEDPASGKTLPTSPVEQLRHDLERLQGETGGQSLKVRLTLAALSERDLGAWQAATDFKATTDMAQSTLGAAVERVYSVYAAVLQALDETVKTAKNADQAATGA